MNNVHNKTINTTHVTSVYNEYSMYAVCERCTSHDCEYKYETHYPKYYYRTHEVKRFTAEMYYNLDNKEDE